MLQWLLVIGLIYFFMRSFSPGSTFQQPGQDPRRRRQRRRNVTPADFELNLLSLASLVIKADGSVNQRELDYVRQYFARAYGKERANAVFKTFNEVVKNRSVSAQRIGKLFQMRASYEVRLQIVHFLLGIAQADGAVSAAEANCIADIAGFMRVTNRDFQSVKAQFFKEVDTAYKILGIEKTATNSDIKKAYRAMAKKYHPDKVQQMGEAHKSMAEEKFKKVQEAYEQLQKERGF